jgi:alpha-tubulin suppressor-like RCC1 family protein
MRKLISLIIILTLVLCLTACSEQETSPVVLTGNESESGTEVAVLNGRTIAGSGANGLAIRTDGSLWAWGRAYNFHDTTAYGSTTPDKIIDDVIAVAGGYNHGLAVKSDGSLWVWGSNDYGQIGDGTNSSWSLFGSYTDNNRPTPVKIMDDVTYIAAGGIHSLAIKTDGSLWTWGENHLGQLGDGGRRNCNTPYKIMDGVVSVTAGYYHNLALTVDGSLWAWGENGSGQLGNGKSGFNESNRQIEHSRIPERIMDDVIYFSASYASSAAVTSDGSLWVWGSIPTLDGDIITDRSIPTKVMDDVIAAEVQNGNVIVLKTDGSLWAWGRSWYGLFGDESEINTLVKILDDVVQIISGSCVGGLAIKNDGSLWAVGGRGNSRSYSGQSEIMRGVMIQ